MSKLRIPLPKKTEQTHKDLNTYDRKEQRKFFKTLVTVEVLSEDAPPEFDNLEELHHQITSGDESGTIISCVQKKITGKQAAKALIKQGSDPGFFQLDEDGNDL